MEKPAASANPQDETPMIGEEPQGLPIRLAMGALGGLAAATVGGVIWGVIVGLTNYEIGFLALGIGLLCALAVSWASRGGKGFPFQMVGMLSSVLGILIGKYYGFYVIFKQIIAEDYGSEAAAQIALLDADLFQIFVDGLPELVDAYDFLWIALAVYTSWRMLSNQMRVAQPS